MAHHGKTQSQYERDCEQSMGLRKLRRMKECPRCSQPSSVWYLALYCWACRVRDVVKAKKARAM